MHWHHTLCAQLASAICLSQNAGTVYTAIEFIGDYQEGARRLQAMGVSGYSLPEAAESQQPLSLPASAAAAMVVATNAGRVLRQASSQCSQAAQSSGIRVQLRVAFASAKAAPAIQSLVQALLTGTPPWLAAEYPAACVPPEAVVLESLASSPPPPAHGPPPPPSPATPPKSLLAAKLAARLEQWREAWAERLASGPSRWAAMLQRRHGRAATPPAS